jgi:hypothetical protein
MSSDKASSEVAKQSHDGAVEELGGEQQTKPVSAFTRWYRSPLFNVIIVGLISFTQPGIWNALNSMSASPAMLHHDRLGDASLTEPWQAPEPAASKSHTLSTAPTL